MRRTPLTMSRKSGLDSATVISLFVPGRPQYTCQQYKSASHMASTATLASFPFFGLWYCPFHVFGQFFQLKLMQSTDPIHPGNNRFAKPASSARSSWRLGCRLRNSRPQQERTARKNPLRPFSDFRRSCGTDRPGTGTMRGHQGVEVSSKFFTSLWHLDNQWRRISAAAPVRPWEAHGADGKTTAAEQEIDAEIAQVGR